MDHGVRPRVVVLGDSVLDVWLSGSCHLAFREVPAPVGDTEDVSTAPGAAANTAANAARAGRRRGGGDGGRRRRHRPNAA
jgi:D-beta-D-heptose 7-phosphate kinase / D-beta-D-heptose 1-phosphate adenosyltransferase